MPSPFSGFQAMRTGMLTHDTYLEAYQISKDKQNYKESFLTDEVIEQVQDLKNSCENDV